MLFQLLLGVGFVLCIHGSNPIVPRKKAPSSAASHLGMALSSPIAYFSTSLLTTRHPSDLPSHATPACTVNVPTHRYWNGRSTHVRTRSLSDDSHYCQKISQTPNSTAPPRSSPSLSAARSPPFPMYVTRHQYCARQHKMAEDTDVC